jgi:hypothetical protein
MEEGTAMASNIIDLIKDRLSDSFGEAAAGTSDWVAVRTIGRLAYVKSQCRFAVGNAEGLPCR